jgi:hypothetical protein
VQKVEWINNINREDEELGRELTMPPYQQHMCHQYLADTINELDGMLHMSEPFKRWHREILQRQVSWESGFTREDGMRGGVGDEVNVEAIWKDGAKRK